MQEVLKSHQKRLAYIDPATLDLRQFLDGRNPYGEHDNSIDKAFVLGKATMEEIVQDRVGFVNGRVLDLLSGCGRWLPFLTTVNTEVVALERIEDCTTLASNMCAHFGIGNVSFMTGDISRIEELDDTSFDFVWMWSGLQYVERAYALTQIRRVLKPGGRLFIGNYNTPGLMGEHIWNGIQQGVVFQGASQWAVSALARGLQDDGNPNFMDLDGCTALCERFDFNLLAAAPEGYLDLRQPNGRLRGWEASRKVGAYFRTMEFLVERPCSNANSVAARSDFRSAVGGVIRRLFHR